MQKWEYWTVQISGREENLHEEMNKAGDYGWEAVGITWSDQSGGFFTVLLKRPKR